MLALARKEAYSRRASPAFNRVLGTHFGNPRGLMNRLCVLFIIKYTAR